MGAVTDKERDRIRKLHARGMSCNAIARELGRSPATISRQCSKMSLSFDRADTEQAVHARVMDLRERRAQAAELLAADAERLRASLWTPCLVYAFGGKENIYEEHTLPEPDPATKLNLMRSIQIAWTTSMKLVEFSAGDAGDAGHSLIGNLAKALSSAAEQLPPDDA